MQVTYFVMPIQSSQLHKSQSSTALQSYHWHPCFLQTSHWMYPMHYEM